MLFSFFILSMSTPVFAQGELTQLTYSPEEPVVLEDVTISINAKNIGDKTQSYFAYLQIIKDGKIVDEKEFTFSLEKDKLITLTPTFVPQDIGEFEVIVRLYDKFKIDLFDTEIIKFNSISQLGPFDIIIDPLTTRVRPGFFLPTQLILENMGTKGTDVEVRVSINCPDKAISQSLTIFLGGGNKTERLVSMQTCDREGVYDIQASIVIFNRTWISSSSTFFVNSTFIHLEFEVPEKIILKPGENYTFPVEVINLGNQKISNLRFVIQRIPLEWQEISPPSIPSINPNEKVLFVVTITLPVDAEQKPYEMRMTALAEETLERKISTLEVVPLAVLPIYTGLPIRTLVITSLSLLAGTVIIFIIKQRIKPLPYQPRERLQILNNIKRRITSK